MTAAGGQSNAEASDPATLLLAFAQMTEETNLVAESVLGRGRVVISDLSLRLPVLAPPELGFLRVVAWLYVQYYEAGRVGVRFLLGLTDPMGVDGAEAARFHLEVTRKLRTYLQHNLDPTSDSDLATRTACEDWFEASCGSRIPGAEDHWAHALGALLQEATSVGEAMLRTVRKVEADPGRAGIVEQWVTRLDRHHPPAAFDSVVSQAAADMGRDFLDATRFRKRHFDRWSNQLRDLDDGYDFEVEARRLVENDLLADEATVMPITGRDLMDKFGLAPGPAVGQTLDRARELFQAEPCSREILLERLEGDEIGSTPHA